MKANLFLGQDFVYYTDANFCLFLIPRIQRSNSFTKIILFAAPIHLGIQIWQ